MGRSGKLPEDERITAPEYLIVRAREVLAQDPRVGERELSIELDDGTVRVVGNVETGQQRDAITSILRELLPDREVDNRTTLTSRHESDHVERVD